MLARLRKMQEEHEGGFTLIELLVVIIIIGILAAIAIPVFLSQRKKGYDSAAKSDLHNFATAEESYLSDYDQYYGDNFSTSSCPGLTGTNSASKCLSTLEGAKQSHNVGPVYAYVPAGTDGTYSDGYCLAIFSRSGNVFLFDSENGGLYDKALGTGDSVPTSLTTCTNGGSGGLSISTSTPSEVLNP